MKKLFALVLLCLAVVILVVGCSQPTDPERVIKEVIEKNLEAAQDEDLDGYLATIHEDSPAYASTEQMMPTLFEQYDVSYVLESFTLISHTETEARVRVVQVTRKVSGPEFRDNRMTAVHVLRPSQGVWKIYNTTIENVEYLN